MLLARAFYIPRITAMTSIDVNSVLSQIRTLSAQAQDRTPATQAPSSGDGFGALIRQSIDGVNAQQQEAGRLQNAFEVGDPSTDISSVMLATGKAQVAFRAMVEVRNRAVSAYQEIMNMQL